MTWNLRYDAAVPPLPPQIVPRSRSKDHLQDMLPHGCWLIRVLPKYDDDVQAEYSFLYYYEGTLRVEWVRSRSEARGKHRKDPKDDRKDFKDVRISGDLYRRRVEGLPEKPKPMPIFGLVSEGIPTFRRSEYRYYVRGIDVALSKNRVDLTLDAHRLDPKDLAWLAEGELKAELHRVKTAKKAELQHDFEGTLTNSSGTEVATVEMKHVSRWLRGAVIEVDLVDEATNPLESQDTHPDVEDVFHEVDWDVEVPRPGTVSEPESAVWSHGMLHEHMLGWRDRTSADLDEEWRYHLLCVRKLNNEDFLGFGVMYDSAAFDSNHIPREGAAIAYGARFPLEEDVYGAAASGEILGQVPGAYFRTAIHELGHAMGLAHNLGRGNSFMEGTRAIALRSGGSFPANIKFSFHSMDACRLRHLPDIWVRPGGLPFRWRFSFEAVPLQDLTDEDRDFKLTVIPLHSSLPLGAPLRVGVSLRNENLGTKRLCPTDLSLKGGHVSGRLVDPLGGIRTFATALRFVEGDYKDLEPGQSIRHSMTLLRGQEGALMPIPGSYSLEIEVAWEVPAHDGSKGGRVQVRGTSQVTVSSALDQEHARTAYKVLGDPHLMLPLVFRSPSDTELSEAARRDLRKARQTLRECLRDTVLRPYFAVIEAKRLGEKPSRAAEAAQLIDESTVMSETEMLKIAEMLKHAETDDARLPLLRRAAKVCRDKAEELGVEGSVAELLPRGIFDG